ncbi:hypothetical protein Ancab_022406 [Ancistrocladus abbreviatus]
MVAKETFSVKVDSSLRGFAILLRSAACEWVLIFFLLLDAAFSYFVTKFAEYCELQLPCILCSRFEHVFGKENFDFYRNILCSNHRFEISSLVSCQIHGKLADVHGMCEECLLSYAMKKESNQETYKFLVGKLGLDGLQNPIFKDFVPGSLGTKSCTCCDKPWRCRPNVQKLYPSRPVGPKFSKPDIPLPSPPRARFLNRRDGLKKRDRFSVSSTPLLLGFSGYDSLSHVGYTEVKITSDSESDFPFSDDEDASIVIHDQNDLNDEYGAQFFPKKQHDDFFPVKQNQQSINGRGNLLGTDLDHEAGEKSTIKHSTSNAGIGYGLGDINCQSSQWKRSHPDLPELISLDDIPLSCNAVEASPGHPANEDKNKFPFSNKYSAYGFSDSMSQDDIPLVKNVARLPHRLSPEKLADVKENGDVGHITVMKIWEAFDSANNMTGPGSGTDQVRQDVMSLPNQNGHGEASVIVSISNGIEESESAEQLCQSDHEGVDKKVNSSTLLKSSVHIPDLSSSNRSSVVNGHADESHNIDASSLSEFHKRLSSPSMERSCSYESLDGSCVSEIEGESLVEWLKRQVEHDRKRIRNLYKELDEERNASAIAANEAMAMITKLQEEKAAVNMEALQYLRMMEEQAEYDVDALEKANDLIAEKDKEIQDLEAELEYYRTRYPDDLKLEHIVNEASDVIAKSEEGEASIMESLEIENL